MEKLETFVANIGTGAISIIALIVFVVIVALVLNLGPVRDWFSSKRR